MPMLARRDQDVAHIAQRDELADQDNQRYAGLDDLERGVAGRRVVSPDRGPDNVRVFLQAVADRVIHRNRLVDALAAPAGSNARRHGCSEFLHQAGVTGSLVAQPDHDRLDLLRLLDFLDEIRARGLDQVAEHSSMGRYPLH
jgi:hypothetical protein